MTDTPYLEIFTLTIIGIFDLLFTFYIFTRYEKTLAINIFGFFALSVSIWVLSNGIPLLFDRDGTLFDLTIRVAFVAPLFLLSLLYLFILLFPYPSIKVDQRFIFALLIPPVIFTGLLYGSKNLVEGFNLDREGTAVFGTDYWIYAFYLLFIYFLTLIELLWKWKNSEGLHRWILKMFFLAILGSGLIGLSANLIFPYFLGVDATGWVGPSSSVIWLGVSLYIVNKR